MKKKLFIMALFLLILCSGIGIVSAETLTGTLPGSGVDETQYFRNGSGLYNSAFNELYVKDMQYSTGTITFVRYDKVGLHLSYPADWKNQNQTNFIGKIGTVQVCSGIIGYQRLYNSDYPTPAEIEGYQYLSFNTWNETGYSGDQIITLTFPDSGGFFELYGNGGSPMIPEGAVATAIPSGTVAFGHYGSGGSMLTQRTFAFTNSYSATKPSGIGITGYVLKDGGETLSPSRVYIINSVTGIPVASDATINSINYNFSTNVSSIIIAAQDSLLAWHNSSVLFTPTGFTPTPTATPIPGATIAPGYIRTTVHIKDRSGALIHGPNIQMKDIEGNVWSNSTSDADGIHFIDTLPGHVVNMYADFTIFENEFLPGSLLVQPAGSTYYLTLYPYESGAGEGTVSLYVEVKEPSGSFIPYANVQITLPNGTSYAGSTANAGSKVFLVPNDTQIRATGSASGYLPATNIGNSGTAGGSTTMTITLTRQIVTTAPTSTVPPGGVTPAVTFDARSDNQKDIDMMNKIRNAGPNLIDLAIMVTMISLLGLMAKGFK